MHGSKALLAALQDTQFYSIIIILTCKESESLIVDKSSWYEIRPSFLQQKGVWLRELAHYLEYHKSRYEDENQKIKLNSLQ